MSRGLKNNFKRMKQKLRAWRIFIQCIFGVSPQTANEALNDSHDRPQEDETKSKIVFRRVRVKALIFLKSYSDHRSRKEIMAHRNFSFDHAQPDLDNRKSVDQSSQWPLFIIMIILLKDVLKDI